MTKEMNVRQELGKLFQDKNPEANSNAESILNKYDEIKQNGNIQEREKFDKQCIHYIKYHAYAGAGAGYKEFVRRYITETEDAEETHKLLYRALIPYQNDNQHLYTNIETRELLRFMDEKGKTRAEDDYVLCLAMGIYVKAYHDNAREKRDNFIEAFQKDAPRTVEQYSKLSQMCLEILLDRHCIRNFVEMSKLLETFNLLCGQKVQIELTETLVKGLEVMLATYPPLMKLHAEDHLLKMLDQVVDFTGDPYEKTLNSIVYERVLKWLLLNTSKFDTHMLCIEKKLITCSAVDYSLNLLYQNEMYETIPVLLSIKNKRRRM